VHEDITYGDIHESQENMWNFLFLPERMYGKGRDDIVIQPKEKYNNNRCCRRMQRRKEGKYMLNGKVAIVTGGTRGIGFEIVRTYLANGAKVVLFGSRQETVEKALAKLKEENSGWEVEGKFPKLTDAAEVERAVLEVKEKFGRIDILVNNAGISQSTPLYNYTAE